MVSFCCSYRFRNHRSLRSSLWSRGDSEVLSILLLMLCNAFTGLKLISEGNEMSIERLLIFSSLVDVEEVMDIDSPFIRDDIILIGTYLLIVP